MNKKVLVITLALVLAFAASAMAAVDFSGDFEFKANQDSFKLFQDEYTFTPVLNLNIKGSNKNTTDDVDGEEWVNWEFEADINTIDNLTFGSYKLSLHDQLFSGHVWGRGAELEDKGTHFDMIKSDKKVEDDIRVRLEVPVNVADLTLDFDPKDNMRAYLTSDLGDVNVGLAYARLEWSDDDDEQNIIVGQADTTVDAGGVDLGLKGALGASLGDDTGLAVGASVDAGLTDELSVDASVKYANEHWEGDGPAADKTVINAGASYTEALYKVALSGEYTIAATNSNNVGLDVFYRMSETLGYDDLFELDDDKWATNDAFAFGAGATIADFETDRLELYAKASSPIVDDVAWAMAEVNVTNTMKDYSAKIRGHILATDKLTIKPKVEFDAKENEETRIDLEVAADYLIGYSDTALNLTVGKEFQENAGDNGRISASIKVPF